MVLLSHLGWGPGSPAMGDGRSMGIKGGSCSWGLSLGSKSKPEVSGLARKIPPSCSPLSPVSLKAPCPQCHLQLEGLLCRQRGEHLPGQLQKPCIRGTRILGTRDCPPWGPGVRISMKGTFGVFPSMEVEPVASMLT